MNEIWKDIKEINSNYSISNKGNIKNNNTNYLINVKNNQIELFKNSKKYIYSLRRLLFKYFTFYEIMPIKILPGEWWLPVKNYPYYYISSKGRVYSAKSNKLLIPKIGNFGYYTVNLSKNGRCKTIRIHRLVAIAFLYKPKDKNYVNHKDFNVINNDVSNLEWCTPKENVIHSKINGRHSTGEKNGRSKLTSKQIIEIREKYNTKKYTQSDLSKIYNISASHISAIIRGKYWSVKKILT